MYTMIHVLYIHCYNVPEDLEVCSEMVSVAVRGGPAVGNCVLLPRLVRGSRGEGESWSGWW